MSLEIKSTILETTSKVSFLTLIGLSIRLPVKLVTAAILNPAGLGLLALAGLIIKYSSYLDLGAHLGMSREVPKLLGKGQADKANNISNLVASWMSALTFIILLLFILFFSLGYNELGPLTLIQALLIFLFQ